MYLKPYKPLRKPKTDLLTYIVRFMFGCFFGAIIGAYLTFRSFRTETRELFLDGNLQQPFELFFTFLGITVFIGVLSALLGDKLRGR